MCPSAAAPSRRERLRAQTLVEIREHGYAQIAQGGPTALSLNGIAKAMGMSGAAMYRYFPSRDALLATLVTESYENLADTLTEAADRAQRGSPERRLRAAIDAYRSWGLEHPHRYRLVFGSTYGSGALAPDRVIPSSQRSMGVIVAAIADLGPADDAPRVGDKALRLELVAWGEASDAPQEPGVLLLALATWTRMHGIVSLEIEGVFDQLPVDPTRLYQSEVDHLVAQRIGQLEA